MRRKHLASPGLILGLVALFVSLSGTALALSAGSIGSREVADEALRSSDLRNGKAVRGDDVADDSLTGADINEGSLALDTGLTRVDESGEFGAGFFHDVLVDCPSGTQALAGGYRLSDRATSLAWRAGIIAIPIESKPIAGGTAWNLSVATPNQEQIRVIGYALCGTAD